LKLLPSLAMVFTYAGAAFFRFDDEARIVQAWVLGDLVSRFNQLGLKDVSLLGSA
jgi:hypothetical protein